MNRLMLTENQIMDFDIIVQKSVPDYFDTNILIYFVLDGEVTFTINGEKSVLKVKDFILAGSCQHHAYHAEGHVLIARFVISMEAMGRYYDIHKMEILCNSTVSDSQSCGEFRRLLESCISHYYGKRVENGKSLVKLNSIYYQILESLVSHFAKYIVDEAEQRANPDEERINEIISYIHANFKRQISLNDLANKMYLSTAYVSRYIKKKLGKNLGEYLTGIRLDFAVRELESTDKSIARIALDNGFPNISSFNKAFKEHYQMTPKGYQEALLEKKKKGNTQEAFSEDVDYRLMDYMEHREDDVLEKQTVQETLYTDAEQYHYLTKTWNRMINIGRAITLLRGDVQEHVVFLQEKLKIEYVRIWDIYDEELQLNIGSQDGRHNFSKFDKIIDFLVNHKLKPYFELGFKPIILLDSYNTFINYEERDILFKTQAEYGRYLEALMIHLANRYGVYEVAQWFFEQWCDPRLFPDGDPSVFFQTFDTAYNTIKGIVPGTKIGGAYDREYDIIDFKRLMQAWGVHNIQPDFMSLYCYRSRDKELVNDETPYFFEAQKDNFLIKYLSDHKAIMSACGMHMPVHISEWNLTVVNRNVLNDSCFKGAYVMKNLMALYAEAEVIGYWFGTDLFVECEEQPRLLDGCCGLLTYHGICKPAFYAIDFMNRMGSYLLGQTENAMVSADGYDNYMIVCHNYKHMGIQYFMQDEKVLKIEKIPFLFDDNSRLKINIQISHVRNGFYYVKTRSISQKSGSIQDEWGRMGLVENLNTQDIDYLRSISIPRITIYEYPVKNNMLEISLSLDPHEIQCIHIYRQIKEQAL